VPGHLPVFSLRLVIGPSISQMVEGEPEITTYADKPWIAQYDAEVPASLAPYPDIPLFALLDQSAARFPDNTAVITSVGLPGGGRAHASLTYRELGELSDRLAAALAAQGIRKGDRVGIILPNCAQFVIAFFGILKAGGVVVALNPTFPPTRWADQMRDSGVGAVVVLARSYDGLNAIRDETPLKHVILTPFDQFHPAAHRADRSLKVLAEGDHWLPDLLDEYTPEQRPAVDLDPAQDSAIFQYTGGTTGVPKAACSPHKALVANSLQFQRWLRSDLPDHEEIFLAAVPLFHVYGMVAVMSYAVTMGAVLVMVPNARDTDDLLSNIDTFKPTIFMGVPGLYNSINFHPDVIAGKYDLSSIRACISGSAPLAAETKHRFEALTGGTLMEGYGMSETPTATHINPLRGENRVGSIGLPFPDVECRIVSLEDEVADVPVGEKGELVLRGPALMTGYHNMPEETAYALRDGWLYTGDVATMDEDGYFYIVDRKKDMVIVGGFNVYPNLVEQELIAHPAVKEAAVAGIPHPDKPGEERVKAWVVLVPGQQVTAKELIDYCKTQTRLAPYEIPRRISFVAELPKSAVGKILRRELVRMESRGR
jgi:long-chain acyl-CoA synthetase